eukprot:6463846-Pyramimonas_sp.AAC.1
MALQIRDAEYCNAALGVSDQGAEGGAHHQQRAEGAEGGTASGAEGGEQEGGEPKEQKQAVEDAAAGAEGGAASGAE